MEQWLEADILSLGMAADEARRRQGTDVTYLRVHDVTLTALAGDLRIPDEASEVRLYELPVSRDEAHEGVRRLRAAAGTRRVAAYSLMDLMARTAEGWGSLDEVLRTLVAAGLSDVAELPIDRVADGAAAVQALARAGAQPRRLTTSGAVGDRRMEILTAARACRAAWSGPISYAPLPRQMSVERPTTGYDDLRTIALARLAMSMPALPPTRIEVDWSLYGPKLAQVALTFGADHLDGVPASSDPALGPRRATVADVERNIRAAGFDPREERPAA
jgi:aminodeoxyfutalosine synthase